MGSQIPSQTVYSIISDPPSPSSHSAMAPLSATNSHTSSALLANFLMCTSKGGQCHRRLAVLCPQAPEPAPHAPCPHVVRCRSRSLRSVQDAGQGCLEKEIWESMSESSQRLVKRHLQRSERSATRMEPVGISSGVGWRGAALGPHSPMDFSFQP